MHKGEYSTTTQVPAHAYDRLYSYGLKFPYEPTLSLPFSEKTSFVVLLLESNSCRAIDFTLHALPVSLSRLSSETGEPGSCKSSRQTTSVLLYLPILYLQEQRIYYSGLAGQSNINNSETQKLISFPSLCT